MSDRYVVVAKVMLEVEADSFLQAEEVAYSNLAGLEEDALIDGFEVLRELSVKFYPLPKTEDDI